MYFGWDRFSGYVHETKCTLLWWIFSPQNCVFLVFIYLHKFVHFFHFILNILNVAKGIEHCEILIKKFYIKLKQWLNNKHYFTGNVNLSALTKAWAAHFSFEPTWPVCPFSIISALLWTILCLYKRMKIELKCSVVINNRPQNGCIYPGIFLLRWADGGNRLLNDLNVKFSVALFKFVNLKLAIVFLARGADNIIKWR